MPNLYPEINLPTLIPPRTSNAKKNFVAPKFDFDAGDFLFDSAGRIKLADTRESFEQWCIKVCLTERNSRACYSNDYGVEFEDALKSGNAAAKSMLIKTLTEAILCHPRAEYVKNFSFELEGDGLKISFDAKGKDFDESNLSVVY